MGRAASGTPKGGLALAVLFLACAALLLTSAASAGGEAGPIRLRDQGFFWVGTRPTPVQAGAVTGTPGTAITGQMYVGFQLAARKRHPYPLVLIHGGGGQSTGWMGTPDGRDGWLDYFLAAGFDVYFVDRPGHGRSPNAQSYGALGAPWTTEFVANLFTGRSSQYPGGGGAASKEVIQNVASTEGGPTVPDAVLKENLAELLDRIGPAILLTHSNGGTSGWLALEARPNLIKGVLAIEPVMGVTDTLAPLITFKPALASGERIQTDPRPPESAGLAPCQLQAEGNVHRVPAYTGKKILFVVAPLSIFASNGHCSARTLSQLGADASVARLADLGIKGNGHFMNEELNNGEIARKVLIPWLAAIK